MNSITKTSASNIALVKYWGKTGKQIPMNPSISMTLQKSFTETTVEWEKSKNKSDKKVSFLFEGQKSEAFEKRIVSYLNDISKYLPFLKSFNLTISSHNSFPHSSGIASSASAMSALALCLVSIEKQIGENDKIFSNELQKASFLARLGSGSAARSIYSGYTLWGKTDAYKTASNEYAIPINDQVHKVFKSYRDAILIVSDQTKKVSSSAGHALMNNHPFAKSKFSESLANTSQLLNILKAGEQMDFVNVVETEALSLHAMMLTAKQPFILIEPNTLTLIHKIQEYRMQTKIPLCFTLDAGANVHLLYPDANAKQVKQWVQNDLLSYCVNKKWIDDNIDLLPPLWV